VLSLLLNREGLPFSKQEETTYPKSLKTLPNHPKGEDCTGEMGQQISEETCSSFERES
jgi:hypothetical protein